MIPNRSRSFTTRRSSRRAPSIRLAPEAARAGPRVNLERTRHQKVDGVQKAFGASSRRLAWNGSLLDGVSRRTGASLGSAWRRPPAQCPARAGYEEYIETGIRNRDKHSVTLCSPWFLLLVSDVWAYQSSATSHDHEVSFEWHRCFSFLIAFANHCPLPNDLDAPRSDSVNLLELVSVRPRPQLLDRMGNTLVRPTRRCLPR